MTRPKPYDGRGTVIAFSVDGTTFAALPALDRFKKMVGVPEYDHIDCIDSDGAIDFPVGVKGERYIAEGPYEPGNPIISDVHAYHQEMRTVYYKVTFKDGSCTTSRCSIVKLELDSRIFKLQIIDHNSQE